MKWARASARGVSAHSPRRYRDPTGPGYLPRASQFEGCRNFLEERISTLLKEMRAGLRAGCAIAAPTEVAASRTTPIRRTAIAVLNLDRHGYAERVSFFEPPPRPNLPEPEEFHEPEWFGPPRHVLGASVPLRVVLARSDEVAIAILDVTAYTNGFELKLVRRSRRRSYGDFDDDFELDHPMMWRRQRAMLEAGELPPELFRFGIEFSDGSKATTLGSHPFEHEPDDEPKGPLLMDRGGGGGGGDWDHRYWVWPLPPEGPLAFVCEWPAKGISLTRHEIDAKLIRDAAAQAEVLWEDPGGPRLDTGGGHMYMIGHSREKDVAESSEQESERPE
jgi:hypothetical protein